MRSVLMTIDRDNINDNFGISLELNKIYEITLVDFSATLGYNKVLLNLFECPIVWYETSIENQHMEMKIKSLDSGDIGGLFSVKVLNNRTMKWMDIMDTDLKFCLTIHIEEKSL